MNRDFENSWRTKEIYKLYSLYSIVVLRPFLAMAFYEIVYGIFMDSSQLTCGNLCIYTGMFLAYSMANQMINTRFSSEICMKLLTQVMSILFLILGNTLGSEYKTLFIICSTTHLAYFQNNSVINTRKVILNSIQHITMWLGAEYLQGQLHTLSSPIFLFFLFFVLLSIILSHRFIMSEQLLAIQTYKKLKKDHFYMNEILQASHQGILIISQNRRIKMKNEFIDRVFINSSYKHLFTILSELNYSTSYTTHTKPIDDIYEFFNIDQDIDSSIGIVLHSNMHLQFSCCRIMIKAEPYILVSIKDITVLLEQESKRAEGKCRGSIVRSISHELRTPINAVIHVVDELGKAKHDPEISRLLEIAFSYSNHLKYVINDIIDFSLLLNNEVRLNKRFFNLKIELSKAVKIMQPQFDAKGLDFNMFLDTLLPVEIYNDPERFTQILMNLLSNAAKFTIAGSVNIYAILSKDSTCNITVKDTGVGIPNIKLHNLFDSSTKLDTNSNTTCGLGLCISNQLALMIGTGLSVTSDLSTGSVFKFSIQITQQISPAFSLDSTSDEDGSCCDETIKRIVLPKSLIYLPGFQSEHSADVLVVDDIPINREILTNLLRHEDILCDEACDGQEAVEMVLEADKKGKIYKLIIMDCDMPRMNGLEAASTLHTFYRTLGLSAMPVILAHSAFSSDQDIRMALGAGMSDYIPKPVSRAELLSKVRRYTT